jgi:hypothetical protein
MVVKVRQRGDQPLLVPAGVAGGAEKYGALVVVNAVHHKATAVKVLDDFRTDQSRRAGDQANRSRHVQVPRSVLWFSRHHNLIGHPAHFQMETC